MSLIIVSCSVFFFNDTATSRIYTLSLHDALPILLDVLLAAEHVPDRLRLRARGLPDVDAEDHRVATRVVVEHRLDRRVRVDAAVPVGLAVDGDRGEGGRQRAGGHHVLEGERLRIARVGEVTQLAALQLA